jgi:nucleotide-binding universal stress UspA family protein
MLREVRAIGFSPVLPTLFLLLRGIKMLPIRTVLYPTDFSESSSFAFRLASMLARDYGARLIVAHVAEPPLAIYGEGVYIPPPDLESEFLRIKLHQLVPRDANVPVEHRLAEGDASVEILRLAKESKADVIVMGTHGRTGLARVLMGSVAEQVVRKAPCPVVTVKTPLPRVPLAEESDVKEEGSPAEMAKA